MSFLKDSTRTTVETTERNPSWIMCLPIVNFLDGSLQPFENLNYAEFQDKDSNWWIVQEFEAEKDEIKNKKWFRYTNIYLFRNITNKSF